MLSFKTDMCGNSHCLPKLSSDRIMNLSGLILLIAFTIDQGNVKCVGDKLYSGYFLTLVIIVHNSVT